MTPRRPKVKNCGTCGTLGSQVLALADMYRRFPEWWDHEPYEAQSALWSLGYADDLVPEEELEAAMQVVRTMRRKVGYRARQATGGSDGSRKTGVPSR